MVAVRSRLLLTWFSLLFLVISALSPNQSGIRDTLWRAWEDAELYDPEEELAVLRLTGATRIGW